jgi:hypothetical protein
MKKYKLKFQLEPGLRRLSCQPGLIGQCNVSNVNKKLSDL